MACCYNCTKRDYPHCYETCEDYLKEKEIREKQKEERAKDFAYRDYARERSKKIERIINNHK